MKLMEGIVNEIQSYYNEGNSLRDCQKKYGYCRSTLIKNIETRPPYKKSNLTEEQRKEKNKKGVVAWRKRTKQKLVDYKGGKCIKCGYNKFIGNLTFHHLDPSKKEFQISGTSISFDKLKVEVDKCVLVCCNCHGEIHAGLISV